LPIPSGMHPGSRTARMRRYHGSIKEYSSRNWWPDNRIR
jgi:hypothetical protein